MPNLLRTRNVTPAPTVADAPASKPDLVALIAAARAEAAERLAADGEGERLIAQHRIAQRAEARASAVLDDLRARHTAALDRKMQPQTIEDAAEKLLAGESVPETKPPESEEFVTARHALRVAESAVRLAEARLRDRRIAIERETVMRNVLPAVRAAERRAALSLAGLMAQHAGLIAGVEALERAGFGQPIVGRVWTPAPLLGDARDPFTCAAGMLREAETMDRVSADDLAEALDYPGADAVLHGRASYGPRVA